jgi:hypothetical protein
MYEKFLKDFILRLSLTEDNGLFFNGESQIVIPSGYNTGGRYYPMFKAVVEHGFPSCLKSRLGHFLLFMSRSGKAAGH